MNRSSNAIWATIVLGGLGTYLIRVSFLAVAHRLAEVPARVRGILRFIPPAALAALVAPGLLRPEGAIDPWSSTLLAGLVAGLVGWWTKNMVAVIVVGMTLLVVLDAL